MAIYNTPDGRQVVGSVESGNDYHGFNGKRDIIIQLTADGATTDGLNALEYLKAYAVEQNKQGNPIFPNGTRVWISANGYTKAVEADDVTIDGTNITIGGIVWNGTAWDYSKAGQGETGLPAVTPSDAGKVLAVNNSGVWGASDLLTNRNSDTLIQIAAEYTNGSYVCISTFDTNDFINRFLSGSDVRLNLTVNGVTLQLYPTLLGSYYLTIVYETYDPVRKAKLRIDFAPTSETTSVFISETDNRFIVTLTPTALDYSGTMDKTVAEITEAYKAGRKIVFMVVTGANTYIETDCTNRFNNGDDYPAYNAYIIDDQNGVIILASTLATNDGTKQTYTTRVYALTPAT